MCASVVSILDEGISLFYSTDSDSFIIFCGSLLKPVAWKRSRLIDRELSKLAEKIRPHMEGRSHEEACEAMVQEMYVS